MPPWSPPPLKKTIARAPARCISSRTRPTGSAAPWRRCWPSRASPRRRPAHLARLGHHVRVGREHPGDVGVDLARVRLQRGGDGDRRGVRAAAAEGGDVALRRRSPGNPATTTMEWPSRAARARARCGCPGCGRCRSTKSVRTSTWKPMSGLRRERPWTEGHGQQRGRGRARRWRAGRPARACPGSRSSARARPIRPSVTPDMAETMTTTSWPRSWVRITRRATLRMRSRFATDVPPYF